MCLNHVLSEGLSLGPQEKHTSDIDDSSGASDMEMFLWVDENNGIFRFDTGVFVQPSDTIASVKRKIQFNNCIPVYAQNLSIIPGPSDNYLDDNRTLASYHIRNNSTVRLCVFFGSCVSEDSDSENERLARDLEAAERSESLDSSAAERSESLDSSSMAERLLRFPAEFLSPMTDGGVNMQIFVKPLTGAFSSMYLSSN